MGWEGLKPIWCMVSVWYINIVTTLTCRRLWGFNKLYQYDSPILIPMSIQKWASACKMNGRTQTALYPRTYAYMTPPVFAHLAHYHTNQQLFKEDTGWNVPQISTESNWTIPCIDSISTSNERFWCCCATTALESTQNSDRGNRIPLLCI